MLVVTAIARMIPLGPGPFAYIGGWRLPLAALVALPLLLRAGSRIRALQTPPVSAESA